MAVNARAFRETYVLAIRIPEPSTEYRDKLENNEEPRQSFLKRSTTHFARSTFILRTKNVYHTIIGRLNVMYERLLLFVGPDDEPTMPSSRTVVWTLITFLAFLILTSLAIRFSTYRMKNAYVSVSSLAICVLIVLLWRDWRDYRMSPDRRKSKTQKVPSIKAYFSPGYRRNLGNSIFTVLFYMILLTVVYPCGWYPDLKYTILQLQEDILVGLIQNVPKHLSNTRPQETPRFPAVAILQDTVSSSQANLVDLKHPKCWVGAWNQTAPYCTDLDPDEYMQLPSCSCNNSISDLTGSFFWATSDYKYFLLTPPPNIFSKQPGYQITFQAYFDCTIPFISEGAIPLMLTTKIDNISKALGAVTITPSPDLAIIVYDPRLSLEQALDSGYSPLNLVNGNGLSSINLNLNLRQSPDVAPTYFYGIFSASDIYPCALRQCRSSNRHQLEPRPQV